ncbi:hypothetical protein V8C86DRAFT_1309050 [Haematococcus lacustris]
MLTSSPVAGSQSAQLGRRVVCPNSSPVAKTSGRPSPSRSFGALNCTSNRDEASRSRNDELGALYSRGFPSPPHWPQPQPDLTSQSSDHWELGADEAAPPRCTTPGLQSDDIVGSHGADILYVPRCGNWTLTDQPGVDLMQAGSQATSHLTQVFVILFGVGERESEGIYSLRAFAEDGLPQETIIVFESDEDASRYAGLLEATMDHCPAVCSIPPEGLRAFCMEHGYRCRLEPRGSLLIPPDFNVGVTDWERSMRLRDGCWAVLESEPELGAAAAGNPGPQVTTASLPTPTPPTPPTRPQPNLGIAAAGVASPPPTPGPAAATPLARYHPSFSEDELRALRTQLERLLPQTSFDSDRGTQTALSSQPPPVTLLPPSAPAPAHSAQQGPSGAASPSSAAPSLSSSSSMFSTPVSPGFETHSSIGDLGLLSLFSLGICPAREPPSTAAAAWYQCEGGAASAQLPSSHIPLYPDLVAQVEAYIEAGADSPPRCPSPEPGVPYWCTEEMGQGQGQGPSIGLSGADGCDGLDVFRRSRSPSPSPTPLQREVVWGSQWGQWGARAAWGAGSGQGEEGEREEGEQGAGEEEGQDGQMWA